MLTFYEFLALNDGLWLNDRPTIPDLSATPQPKSQKPQKLKSPPKLKPVPKAESLSQLARNVDALVKLGIGLFPPQRDDMERLLDRFKNQVVVPQTIPSWQHRFKATKRAVGRTRGQPRSG